MSIGERIKEKRKSLNISRQKLAKDLGVSVSAVSNWENNIGSPTVENVCRLMFVLQCDANYLFQDEVSEYSISSGTVTYRELEAVKKYRSLSKYGKKAVVNTLVNEYERDHGED